MADQERHDLIHDLLKQHAALRAAHSLDPRYAVEAYHFVCEAVDHTCRKLGDRRHVSGRELLDGICELALDHFGYLAPLVLEHWGITATDAFGDIVFTLVDCGLLGRSPEDDRSDFHDVFGLRETLDERYSIQLDDTPVTHEFYLWPYQETPG